MTSVAILQPVKHPSFIYYEKEPFNGGPLPSMARGEFITPTDLFYVRCHGNIPELDAAKYRLHIKGLVARPVELTLENLRSNFAPHTVAATLQCAMDRQRDLPRRLDGSTALRRAR